MIADPTVHAIDLIQGMIRASGAAKYAPDYAHYPASLVNVDMPTILTYPAQGKRKVKTGHTDLRRKYYLEGFIAKMGTLTTREMRVKTGQVIDKLALYIDRLNDGDSYILDYGEQSGVYVGIDWGTEIEDSGPVANIDFTGANNPAEKYFGFQVILPMQVRWGERV